MPKDMQKHMEQKITFKNKESSILKRNHNHKPCMVNVKP